MDVATMKGKATNFGALVSDINQESNIMINAGEPVLVCPYNKAHSIIKSRMQFHLAKCRAQNPHSEKTVCPYNSTHIIAKVELEYHQQECPNRIVLDSFLYNVGNSTCPVEDVPVNVPPEALAPCEENWDTDPPVNVLDIVRENAREKDVLLNLIGAPKAERKAHRIQERLRFQRVVDAKEAEKKGQEENTQTAFQEIEKPQDPVEPELPKENESEVVHDRVKSEEEFEVVNYHKKGQGKKGKQQQQQQAQQQKQLRYPSQTDETEVSVGIMTQLTKIKHNDNLRSNSNIINDDIRRANSSPDRIRRPEINLNRNAWDKPLNMNGGGRTNDDLPGMSARPIDGFPSLPVSGRGRFVTAIRQ